MKKTLTLLTFGALLAGCGDSSKPPLDYVPHMFDSQAVKAQHLGPNGENAGRVAPEGTLSVNQEVYRYATDPEAAGRELKNPVKRTKENLLKGRKLFDTYCMVCHGKRGEGDGLIVPKFPRPPSLQSDKVRGWSDGRIFHVMTMGQNLMPSYASQINAQERWAIVNYVRVLQRADNPTAEDLKEFEKLTK